MQPIISESEAKQLDELTIKSGFCSGDQLMHNAGKAIAIWFLENIRNPFNCRVLVLSGKGNNGGDGIIAYHYLKYFGVQTTLMLMDEAQMNRSLISDYQIEPREIVFYHPDISFSEYDWLIDAIFGIGLSRNITGRYAEIIKKINDCALVISVDIPSGIYTDTGMEAGISVKAYHTITMGYKKTGHLLNTGKTHSGQVHVVNIGFKPVSVNTFSIHNYEKDDIRHLVKNYSHNINKYTRGKSWIIAGSMGMTGAAILSAKAAVKIGCGLVKSIIPSSINSIFESVLTEIITVPIEDNQTGHLTTSSLPFIDRQIDWPDALLVGPGLSNSIDSVEFITELLCKPLNALVLDATGFEPLIRGEVSLSELPKKTVLTPHMGEFSKIFKMDPHSVKNDPVSALKTVIRDLGEIILVLKGSPTFITTGGGHIIMISNGSPLLATAGTGDVLSGMITGLIAQGYTPLDSSVIGTFIHAQTSTEYISSFGSRGLIASDILDLIPAAITKVLYEI